MTEAAASANGSNAAENTAANSSAGTQTQTTETTQQTAGNQTQTAASGEQKNQQASAPEFKLKAPEGFDPAGLPKIAEVAKNWGLTPENAQKLLDQTHANQIKAKADTEAALSKQKQEWVDAVKADPAIGGEKFEATIARAVKVVGEIDAKVAPGIKQLLESTGYGDHPAVVRLFAYLGEKNREDSFSTPGGAPAGAPQTMEQILYPSTKAA